MPELPEVETLVRELQEAKLVNIPIVKAEVFWLKTLSNLTPEAFAKLLKGSWIVSFRRRAKYLVWELNNGYLIYIHLKMTGRFIFKEASHPRLPHEHVIWGFADGREIRFHDTRKFGRIFVVKGEEFEKKFGPEPLSNQWSYQEFREALKSKKRQIKPLLLDQQFLAGLGNIYVDEALWEARIHPLKISSGLTELEMQALHQSIPLVLERGLLRGGTTLGRGINNFYRLSGNRGEHQLVLNVFRRTGEPCPRCGTAIERIVVGQRSTHYCPNCQKLD